MPKDLIVVMGEENEAGYLQLRVKPVTRLDAEHLALVWGVFRSKAAAVRYLRTQVEQHGLCDRLNGGRAGKRRVLWVWA